MTAYARMTFGVVLQRRLPTDRLLFTDNVSKDYAASFMHQLGEVIGKFAAYSKLERNYSRAYEPFCWKPHTVLSDVVEVNLWNQGSSMLVDVIDFLTQNLDQALIRLYHLLFILRLDE